MQQFNYDGVPRSAGHPVIASQEALCSMNLTVKSDAVMTLANNGGCTGHLLQQLEHGRNACHYRTQIHLREILIYQQPNVICIKEELSVFRVRYFTH